MLEEHRWCVEQGALELVSHGNDQSLCHPGADSTQLPTSQKPWQGGESVKMLGCVCLVLLLVSFFWAVAGGSEQRWSQFPFLGGEECWWQGCSPCGGCRWGASCL